MPKKTSKKKFDVQAEFQSSSSSSSSIDIKKNIGDVPRLKIQNVVSTYSLGVRSVNLINLASQLPFVEFNPKKFAAATVRLKSPQTTALIFASGNIVCTGAKNEVESRLSCRKYVSILQKHNIPVYMKNFKIQNIVASVNIKMTIDTEKISQAYGIYVSWEPELFPGLIFRTVNPKLVMLIFRSGKIVLTGAKSVKDIETVFSYFYLNIIHNYRDENKYINSKHYLINKRAQSIYR